MPSAVLLNLACFDIELGVVRSIGLVSGMRGNPEAFIPNVFFGKRTEYKRAVTRVFYTPRSSSFVELPVVESGR